MLFQLAIQRRKTAVEAHHQCHALLCGQFDQLLTLIQRFRQRFIHIDVYALRQQFPNYLKMASSAAVYEHCITLLCQAIKAREIGHTIAIAYRLGFLLIR
ncbi:hypothetical protein D3C75_871560 [compost metagenome]